MKVLRCEDELPWPHPAKATASTVFWLPQFEQDGYLCCCATNTLEGDRTQSSMTPWTRRVMPSITSSVEISAVRAKLREWLSSGETKLAEEPPSHSGL